jgi:glycosyltransferase involved in cell wall biosynthesis
LWFYPEKPALPAEREFALVNRYRAFHVVTRQNYEELKTHCPGVRYLTNPVNMSRFPESTPVKTEVVASWNGNAKHMSASGQDVKGFWSIIAPAVKATGVPFEFAEYNTRRRRPNEMPAFYQKANLSISMSRYEGASNSIMEGMAAGHALISTDVGNVREMQESQLRSLGETGILIIDRSIPALIEAIQQLRKDPVRVHAMGALNRKEITEHWAWDHWKEGYAEFLRQGL